MGTRRAGGVRHVERVGVRCKGSFFGAFGSAFERASVWLLCAQDTPFAVA